MINSHGKYSTFAICICCATWLSGHKLGSNQVGPAGIYLGAIVVSPVEPWAGYSDSEVDEDDELGRVWLDSIPRVFRITKAAPIGAYADTHRVFNKNTAGPGGTDRGRMECIETTHEHHVSWVDLSPTIRASSGWTPPRTTEQSMSR